MYDFTTTFCVRTTESNQINEERVPLAYNVIKGHYSRTVKYTPSKLALDLCCMVHFG